MTSLKNKSCPKKGQERVRKISYVCKANIMNKPCSKKNQVRNPTTKRCRKSKSKSRTRSEYKSRTRSKYKSRTRSRSNSKSRTRSTRRKLVMSKNIVSDSSDSDSPQESKHESSTVPYKNIKTLITDNCDTWQEVLTLLSQNNHPILDDRYNLNVLMEYFNTVNKLHPANIYVNNSTVSCFCKLSQKLKILSVWMDLQHLKLFLSEDDTSQLVTTTSGKLFFVTGDALIPGHVYDDDDLVDEEDDDVLYYKQINGLYKLDQIDWVEDKIVIKEQDIY